MGNVIGQPAQEPVDVPMVALCEHIGYNYNNKAMIAVKKGEKFFTTQGRALRLVENGTAALDMGDEPEVEVEPAEEHEAPAPVKIDKRSKAYRKGR